ncbi:hypothetical protein GCM10027592_63130 [Spirosoma flavus]
MNSDAQHIRGWYRAIKEASVCVTCQYEGLLANAGKVEFYHINASAKSDTLSNMAIRPTIMPLQYAVAPLTYAIELRKVAPMCPDHHRELHRAEDKGNQQTLRQKFDLTAMLFTKLNKGISHGGHEFGSTGTIRPDQRRAAGYAARWLADLYRKGL